MKKGFKFLLVLLIFMPCVFLLSACNSKTVVDIYKNTNSTDIISVYTVEYSDGSTSTFSVENGKDGADLNVEDIYEVAKSRGLVSNFSQFLELYLNYDASVSTQNINKAMTSTVAVTAQFPVTKTSMGNYEKSYDMGFGSGVIYKLDKSAGDAYIITNYHVVYNSNSESSDKIASVIKCFLYGSDISYSIKKNVLGIEERDVNGYPVIEYGGGFAIDATYVGGSMNYDIAVLKVTNSNVLKQNDCRAVSVYNSDDVIVGTDAYAIGNPDGDGISVTKGVVSVESERLEMTGADGTTPVNFRVMRIDTAVNNGNSGGGLYNSSGKLIGIVNAKIIDSKVENIGFAIPSNIATRVADSIIKYSTNTNKKAYKATLGIMVASKNIKAVYNEEKGKTEIFEDVYIHEITEGSIVSNSGLSVGDKIKSATLFGVKYVIDRSFKLVDLCWLLEIDSVLTFEIEGKENVALVITADSFSYVD